MKKFKWLIIINCFQLKEISKSREESWTVEEKVSRYFPHSYIFGPIIFFASTPIGQYPDNAKHNYFTIAECKENHPKSLK